MVCDGSVKTDSLVVVEAPIEAETLTTTQPWSGSFTTTYTTNTVITNSDGSVATEDVVIIETPRVSVLPSVFTFNNSSKTVEVYSSSTTVSSKLDATESSTMGLSTSEISISDILISTTIITVTSCTDNKCIESTINATPVETTEIIRGETSIYTTYCEVTENTGIQTTESTTEVFVTSCANKECNPTVNPSSTDIGSITTNSEVITTSISSSDSIVKHTSNIVESNLIHESKTIDSNSQSSEVYNSITTDLSELNNSNTGGTTLSTATQSFSSSLISYQTISTYQGSGYIFDPLSLIFLLPLAMIF